MYLTSGEEQFFDRMNRVRGPASVKTTARQAEGRSQKSKQPRAVPQFLIS